MAYKYGYRAKRYDFFSSCYLLVALIQSCSLMLHTIQKVPGIRTSIVKSHLTLPECYCLPREMNVIVMELKNNLNKSCLC